MNYQQLEKLVLEWAEEKEILKKATPLAQCSKTIEEVEELKEALTQQNALRVTYKNSKGKICNTEDEIKDAFGDILVTIIIGAEMQGLKLEDCLEIAYNIIKNRTGKIINGQFVKKE